MVFIFYYLPNPHFRLNKKYLWLGRCMQKIEILKYSKAIFMNKFTLFDKLLTELFLVLFYIYFYL